MKRSLFMLSLAAVSLGAPTALAQDTPSDESWMLTLDAIGAVPIGDPWADQYGLGVLVGAGLYRSLSPVVLLGGRLDGGRVLGEDIGPIEVDDLDLGALSAAVRLRPLADPNELARGTGLHLEAAGGIGILDAGESETRPVVQAGVSYLFDAGSFGIGPTARYLQTIVDDVDDLRLVAAGVELTFLDRRGRTGRGAPARAGYAGDSGPPDDAPATPAADEDRWTIEETTFFDYDKAELRPSGRAKLDEIATAYKTRGETWSTLKVQGHADNRGPKDYNQVLSRERAQNVKNYLVSQGVPADILDVEAYGEERPVVFDATTEAEYQKNRRVEFVIVHK
jgi:OOP family OmpA-OmpF porin